MKRIILSLFLITLSLGAMAQKIVYDGTNGKVRTVIYNSQLITPTDAHELVTVALAGFETDGIRRFALAVSIHADHKFTLPANGTLTLTLGDGKEIVLKGTSGGESILRSVDVYSDRADELTTRFNYYELPKKYISTINKKGIVATRIDMDPEFVSETHQAQLTSLIVNSYDLLVPVLKNK